jgi:hypothetical protein
VALVGVASCLRAGNSWHNWNRSTDDSIASASEFPCSFATRQGTRRIVARIDELMDLCDRLEAQLTIAQTGSRHLLEALFNETLAPAV